MTNTSEGLERLLDARIASLFVEQSQESLFQNVCDLGRESIGGVGVAILSCQQDSMGMTGQIAIVTTSPPLPHEDDAKPTWFVRLVKPFGQMLRQNIQTIRLSDGAAYGVYVPLFTTEQDRVYLAAYVADASPVHLQNVVSILQLLKAVLILTNKKRKDESAHSSHTPTEHDSALLNVVNILSETQEAKRFFDTATTLCATLAQAFQCRRVALGLARKHSVKLLALDQMENFSRGTRTVRMLEDAMQEAHEQRSSIFYTQKKHKNPDVPQEDSAAPLLVTRATAALAKLADVAHIITIPLYKENNQTFVLLFQIEREEVTPNVMEALHLVGALISSSLCQRLAAEESPLKKLWRYFCLRSEDIFGPRRTMLKLASTVLVLSLALALLIPGRLIVAASMVIEGVHSYTHTAPMDSYLSAVLVRPGDEVKVGQVLGRLDSTEITLEIAALESQRSIYDSQASQHLQEGKDAEAAIARHESARTAANLAWAQERLAMTELRSSVDGFLVSEDMLSRLGQPVQRGQALFEITDAASLRLVAHVSEEDISDIMAAISLSKEEGREVAGSFTLTAYPDMEISFSVERVHPYATVEEDRNGFEVRGRTENVPEGLILRPGMEGHAKIDVGERPWLHLLFRKLINKVRLLWWRWL